MSASFFMQAVETCPSSQVCLAAAIMNGKSICVVSWNYAVQLYAFLKRSLSIQEHSPWVTINYQLKHDDYNTRRWWQTTGLALASLLQKAGYSRQSQLQHLLFYYSQVAPILGAAPDIRDKADGWKSFMTDSFTPIEVSWDWGCGVQSPTIRYSFEPIGRHAGAGKDPLNRNAALSFIHQFKEKFSETNLLWYEHFSKELAIYKSASEKRHNDETLEEHQSRIFFAFDLAEGNMMLKAYFFPLFKAALTGKSNLAVIADAIASLPGHPSFPAFVVLQDYLTTTEAGSMLEVEILSIDCGEPAKSRLKVYVRSRATSFRSVRVTMTLGGLLDEPGHERGFQELLHLWKLVLGKKKDFYESDDLPHVSHRTAGILYYFDFRAGQGLPEAKVYLPVRHYGQNDLGIALGLKTYLESRDQGILAFQYVEALRSIRWVVPALDLCSVANGLHRRNSILTKQRGVQTYIGCSVSNGSLKITSYIDPEAAVY